WKKTMKKPSYKFTYKVFHTPKRGALHSVYHGNTVLFDTIYRHTDSEVRKPYKRGETIVSRTGPGFHSWHKRADAEQWRQLFMTSNGRTSTIVRIKNSGKIETYKSHWEQSSLRRRCEFRNPNESR